MDADRTWSRMTYQTPWTTCVICANPVGEAAGLTPLQITDFLVSRNGHNDNRCDPNLSLSNGLFPKECERTRQFLFNWVYSHL